MARKLSEVVVEALKAKKVSDIEELKVSPASLEKVKAAIEQQKPKNYGKVVALIDGYLESLIEEEEEEEEENAPVEKAPVRNAGKAGTSKAKTEPKKEESFKLLGKEYVKLTMTQEEMVKSFIPQTNVLLLVNEGLKEVTVFTVVWISDTHMTLVDLSTKEGKGQCIMINTKKFFKDGSMESETEGFDAKLVAILKEKK